MLFHFEKDSNNYQNYTFLLHAPLIFIHIMHIYADKRKYPKYYSNQISKYFDNQKRVFKGVVFCTPHPPTPHPLGFIPPKSLGLTGLS